MQCHWLRKNNVNNWKWQRTNIEFLFPKFCCRSIIMRRARVQLFKTRPYPEKRCNVRNGWKKLTVLIPEWVMGHENYFSYMKYCLLELRLNISIVRSSHRVGQEQGEEGREWGQFLKVTWSWISVQYNHVLPIRFSIHSFLPTFN